jgi:proton-dependent oligopeptide transporter, POT family
VNAVQPQAALAAVCAPEAPGHPRGLYFLAFTEAWERFSYYGMVALVVLYMVNQLLLPGHAEHVLGMARLRSVLEAISGPLSRQALASQIVGLYGGLVYFTPLLGGAIADRWLGQRVAVVIGALAMAAGHIAMGFDASFLLALALLVVGSGFLKGNIATQVGALYPPEDEARRTRGFVIFSTGINVGAVTGPLLCGLLAQLYGWQYGFGIAALFMLLGLVTYLCGYRHLPARAARQAAVRLSKTDGRTIRLLLVIMLLTVFESVSYLQIFDVMPVWTEQHVVASVAGFVIPVPWYQSLSALFSIIGVPFLFWIWRRQAQRGAEPDDVTKIATGAWLFAAANLTLVAGLLLAGGARVSPLWPFLYAGLTGIAFLYYWPTLLAMVSQEAPPALSATLVSTAYVSLFFSNTLVGWVGSFYEKMSGIAFWSLHALIGAVGGIVVLLGGRSLVRALHAQPVTRVASAGERG